jgi:hypothetical protein
MNEKDNTENLPDLENPPLVKVVCGISFKALGEFKIPHYSLFWNAIKELFPVCQHAPSLVDFPLEMRFN